MNTAHTPGPWYPWIIGKTRRTTESDKRLMVLHPDGERLIARLNEGYCSPRSGEISREEREANAYLIAAAPELLAALEKIDANAAESVEWIRRVAQEAIAKARGQS